MATLARAPWVWILAALAAAAPRPARAQSAEAEVLFADGDRLMKQGDYPRACEALEGSNRLEPRAGTLIRLGECREQTHELASAWSAYKDALTRVRDPRKRALAVARLAALEPVLSYLIVAVPDESRIDGLMITRNGQPLDPALWNRAIPVNGGAYVIAGRAPGHEEWQTTAQVPTASGKISVEVPRFKELAALAPGVTSPAQPAPPAVPTDAERSPERSIDRSIDTRGERTGWWSTRRSVAVGVAGTGAVAIAAGVVLGLRADDQRSEARGLCPDPAMPCTAAGRANDLVAGAHDRALAADVAFVAGGAAMVGAAILWWTGAPTAHRVAVVPAGAGALLIGRF